MAYRHKRLKFTQLSKGLYDMKITFFPFLYEDVEDLPHLEVSVKGDKIFVNKQEFDFSPIPEGFKLPTQAVDSDVFVKGSSYFIERKAGELSLTLYLPALWNSPDSVRIPDTPLVISITDGNVPLPDIMPELPPVIDFVPPAVPEQREDGATDD